MTIIKVLTLKQPWAWCIFHAGKDIENRRWFTDYRGILYIHAGKSYDSAADAWIKWKFDIQVPPREQLQFGMIIGAVMLTGIETNQHKINGWAIPDQYHWQLKNPTLLENPVQAKGKLGIWNYELENNSGNLSQSQSSNQTRRGNLQL